MGLIHYEITERVIGLAIEVHRQLGPGLLESAYQRCLAHRLRKRCLKVDEQIPVTIKFDELEIPGAYKIDMVIENVLMLELKAVDQLAPVHIAQALTYLKFSGLEAGLILNFNSIVLRDGLKRVFNNKHPH